MNNALDALDQDTKKEIKINVLRKDRFVCVTIADTGCGITAKNLIKIYDPFFTTKPVGEGTGLGLSVCQSIIKEHGGEITCESELGKGTKFTVFLPIRRN